MLFAHIVKHTMHNKLKNIWSISIMKTVKDEGERNKYI